MRINRKGGIALIKVFSEKKERKGALRPVYALPPLLITF